MEVIDGDTIRVMVELGFTNRTPQKIRLRGIDTPPLSKPAGQNAKNYVESQLKNCEIIAIKTHSRDKFDRYLSDIFYLKNTNELNKIIQKGHYLNQELIDKNFAVAYIK
jgi:endonuclease YncB( thermonuclease family)